MQQSQIPVRLNQAFRLTDRGLGPELFKLGNISFESEKYITVRDGNDLVIVDVANSFNTERKNMKAEGSLMHREKNIIAVRATQGASTFIQVFDLGTKQKVKQCEIPEQVTFWKWVDINTLGVVGAKKVYHVDITNQAGPEEILERAPQLASCLIMNYGVDSARKWAFVVGLGKNPQGGIQCQMQLYSIERKQQQMLEGVAGSFTDVQVTDAHGYKNSLFVFCEKKAAEQVQRLHIMEIGNPAPGQQKFKKSVEIQFPADAQGDLPLIVHCVEKYGVVFIVTKMGYLYMYEMSDAVLLYRQRITDQTMVVSCKNSQTHGMIAINAAGQILSVNVDENNLIPFVSKNPGLHSDAVGLSFKMAQRFGLKGADDLFVQQFNRLLASGDYAGSARIAASAPGDLLRNQETINKFKTLPSTGGPLPIMVYFSTLLQSTTLNALETVELAKPVIQQNRVNMIEEWFKQQKLTVTNELLEIVRPANPNLAAVMGAKSGNPDMVIQSLVGMGHFDKIVPYCQQQNHNPDWNQILRQAVMMNAEQAVGLALMLTSRENGQMPKIPIDNVAQLFLEGNKIKESTAFLLRALEHNRPDESHLQTKLFEINLMSNPQIAEGIFQMNKFTQFDRERVAKMCEQVGLYGRALMNYSNMADVKRVLLNTHAIPKEQLIEYFGRLGEEDALACMYDLLKSNRQNMGIVAEIAVKYSSKIDTKKSIQVLESFGTSEGMLFFLASVLPNTDDPEIYFKYIEACTRLGNYKEVERVIKETDYYDAERVKNFLKDAKLADPRPLIHLCEKHKYIDELTKYLYNNKQKQFIEVYLHRVNQAAAPKVLSTLLEVDCDETYIKQLLNSIRACPIDELVEEFQKKGKLKLLQGWLEARNDERLTDTALHNALAIIYIDINKDPQNFLINNQYYDSKEVGKYCEDRNPDLAYIAYKRAWGSCDAELVEVTNKNYLYKLQAKYLVERQSPELWATVLTDENPHKRDVIDQVVGIALPDTKNPDEVSTTVKAFMDADMPNELIELLEKIVLHNSDFAANKNLQNLLILTAIKADTTRVMDYINRLDQYDGQELAKIARKEQYQLFEEAFAIYQKCGEHVDAMKVLIEDIKAIKRAAEYAQRVNRPEVWTELGRAYLNEFNVKESIDCFIRAKDPSMYAMVIGTAQNQDCWEELVSFLQMARETLKEQMIDTELVYALAKCGQRRLPDLEMFISDPNQADLTAAGERCVEDRLNEAAKLIFTRLGNSTKLATVLVRLGDYQSAFNAAKKADIPKVWKEVCFACVRAKEFRTAGLCGVHIIIHPDHLDDLIKFYERFGYYEELIQLLESGMSLERTHNGIFTELGIMYAKYDPMRLMDHARTYCQRLLIPKLIRACEQYHMWNEAVFLHSQYDQFDQAINTMMEHSPSCWKHDLFAQNIVKVSNHDLYYKAMLFYLEEEPMLLNDLLRLLTTKIDLAKCVAVMKNTGHIGLIQPFLKSVQSQNVSAVNEALNNVYMENDDHENLRASIKEYQNFDSLDMSSKLEVHELLEFRRIAALLYRKNKRYQQSIDISKKDELYKDAMETVAEAKDSVLAEDLLRFITEMQDKELFAAMLYTCYELIKPDVALEIGWRHGMLEFVMPFFIQFTKDIYARIETVHKSTEDIKKNEEKKAEENAQAPLVGAMGMMGEMFNPMGAQSQFAAIMPAPGNGMGTGQMGANPMSGGFYQ